MRDVFFGQLKVDVTFREKGIRQRKRRFQSRHRGRLQALCIEDARHGPYILGFGHRQWKLCVSVPYLCPPPYSTPTGTMGLILPGWRASMSIGIAAAGTRATQCRIFFWRHGRQSFDESGDAPERAMKARRPAVQRVGAFVGVELKRVGADGETRP